jgi:uncharacterized protein
MAVITKYVVVRNGIELDQVFLVKREADAYDKMLDAAENLATFIKDAKLDIDIDENKIDEISIYLAKNGPEVIGLLRGVKPVLIPQKSDDAKLPGAEADKKVKKSDEEIKPKPKGKAKGKKGSK